MPKKNSPTTATTLSFHKVLKKTSFVYMTVPFWFVNAHGDKFTGTSMLGYGGRNPDWKMKLNVNLVGRAHYHHVAFASGFREFCNMYQFKEGDRLEFELIRKNCFNVTCANADASTSNSQAEEVASNSI